jgi:hypothetical protein
MTRKELVNRKLELQEKKANYQILVQRLDTEIERIQKLIEECEKNVRK